MSIITFETRRLSHEDIKPEKEKRYKDILSRLMTGPKTAKETAIEMFELNLIPGTDRNFAAPRLTELAQMGLVKEIDKKKCQYSGRKVAIYEITPKGIEYRYMNHIPSIEG